MRRLWLLMLSVVLLASAGCDTESPTSTPSAHERTQIARTVLAINVQQTLTAQAQQGAMVPVIQPSATSPPTSTPPPSPTIAITLTYTPTPTTTATISPTPASAPELAPAAASTQALLNPDAEVVHLKWKFYLELDYAGTRDQAGWYRPSRDYFLVLFGTFVNDSDERVCVYSRQIRLGFEGDKIVPYVEAMNAVRNEYDIDYPGPIRGQCVEANTRSPTFILFDAPAIMTTFAFRYRDERNGSVTLTPRADGTFGVTVNE